METMLPASYIMNSNWLIQENYDAKWTKEENKRFESALAIFDKETPDRWIKVASMIPGKTVYDVMKQYKELLADVYDIEAGLVPIPGYFTLDLVDNGGFDEVRRKGSRSLDHEKKKGVPWTEDEHRRFLLGLQKHGKGDWRNISRNFVVSKTPTQVASHAQKYYLRQLSGGKDKRRPSIHDITTANLTDTSTPSNNIHSPPLDDRNSTVPTPLTEWNRPNNGSSTVFGSTPTHCHRSLAHLNGAKLEKNGYGGSDVMGSKSSFQFQSWCCL